MAKKTNKTNHVLNLLSGADEQDAEVKKATEETEPKIQIVNQNQEDSIAADVQQMLEEELLQEEQTLQAQREKETEWQTEAAAADAAASVLPQSLHPRLFPMQRLLLCLLRQPQTMRKPPPRLIRRQRQSRTVRRPPRRLRNRKVPRMKRASLRRSLHRKRQHQKRI